MAKRTSTERKRTEKAKQAEKNPYSVFTEKDDEEVCMEEESVVFTDSSSSDHLPKGTLPRLPTCNQIMEGFNLTIILVLLLILFSSMDLKHKIIPNYNEVSLLISEYNPSVFCFQETFLKPDDNISLRGFNIYNYVHTDCLRPSGGASIFVKSSFPQRKIDLQTKLQATAVSVTLDREITICSVYIPPSFSLNSQHLDNLLQQLPSPYILLCDFNGHNFSGVVKTMIPEVNLSKISLQRMTFVL